MRFTVALLLPLSLLAACDRQSPAPSQQAEGPADLPVKELTGTLDISKRGTPAPDTEFLDGAGETVTLADFKGKPVLVNLWATWCAPCVAEMPTLDALAGRASDKLLVLTVSQDAKEVDIAPVFRDRGLERLAQYRDPDSNLGFAFATGMVPTTVLYDAEGKEVWRVIGGMDWNGPRANTLLADAIGG